MGIIGLCTAVVCFIYTLISSQILIAYVKLEHTFVIASQGLITHKMIKAVEDKGGIPKMPLKLNTQSGNESYFACAFSHQNWEMEKVKKHTVSQIKAIIQAAEEAPLTLAPKWEGTSLAMVTDKDNWYNNLCKSVCSEQKLLIIGMPLL